MKKKFFLSAALAFLPFTASAQPAPAPKPAPSAASVPGQTDADPAMWLVKDEDTNIYLFGTFHLLDGRPWFNDEVKTAFDASDELVLEAIIPENPAELQPLVMQYAVDQKGRKLSQRLNADQNEKLGKALAAIGAPAAAFDPLEPWFVSMTLAALASQKLGINAANGPEGVLIRAAKARNMPVSELEGLEWQIKLFDNMPEEQQISQLRQSIDNLEGMSESMAPMLAAWSTGDVDGLQKIVTSGSEQDPALHRLIFTERNKSWADWVQARLQKPGTVFVAVGAGHLAGSDSVQSVLNARGVPSERVAAAPESSAP